MTDKQRAALQRRIEEHTRSIARDPEAARASLIRMGIIDEDGRLTPEYQPETDRVTIVV
ncbi:ATP-binding protein [Lichenibacterium ramalinae]|uniref:ATP-binding protein n=1 Tax=Lichenibacterium ramalinae TaxID=2316527 RepID=UPI0013EC87AF|nr:ATP-binding protein [Lichenibacterium ramalinae]